MHRRTRRAQAPLATSATDTLEFRSLAPRVVTNAGQGTLTLQLDGSYTFVPAPGFVGTTTFPYSLANIDELPQCPINPRVNATLTIEVVATAQGSFDGTFTPVSAQTGPCILVDTSTIDFGDVPTGSTAWVAPTDGRTTTLSSCSPSDQVVDGGVSTALGGRCRAHCVARSHRPILVHRSASSATAWRPEARPQPGPPVRHPILTTVPAGVVTLQRATGVATIEHYLIGPAAGTPGAGTGFQFAVTFVATVRS